MLSRLRGALKKGLSASRKPSKQPRLADILADSVNLHFFARYCAAKQSADALIAWIEVRSSRGGGALARHLRVTAGHRARARTHPCTRARAQIEQYKSANARLLRRHRALKLVSAYLEDAARAAALGVEEARDEILERWGLARSDPPADLFDRMQALLEASLERALLSGFVGSTHHKQMLAAAGDFNAVLSVKHFDLLKFLGAGGYGMVLLARHRTTRRLYAMKVLDKRLLIARRAVFSVFREKATLAHVLHPFVVSLKYALETEHHLLLVTDYESGGNMYSNLARHGAYPLERARLYAAQMVLAISQLHEIGVLYRDMKPDNILLDADGQCKLADMGAARGELAGGEIDASRDGRDKTLRASELHAAVSLGHALDEAARREAQGTTGRLVPKPHSSRMTISGTHGYRAPEVYLRAYGRPADWWNLGLLIVEMLTGKVRAPARPRGRRRGRPRRAARSRGAARQRSMGAGPRAPPRALLRAARVTSEPVPRHQPRRVRVPLEERRAPHRALVRQGDGGPSSRAAEPRRESAARLHRRGRRRDPAPPLLRARRLGRPARPG